MVVWEFLEEEALVWVLLEEESVFWVEAQVWVHAEAE